MMYTTLRWANFVRTEREQISVRAEGATTLLATCYIAYNGCNKTKRMPSALFDTLPPTLFNPLAAHGAPV